MKTFGYLASILLVIVHAAHGAEYTFTKIEVPNALYTIAEGLNDDGDVVGAYAPELFGPEHGFLFLDGQYSEVAVPDAQVTIPFGINRKGVISGIYVPQTAGQSAFILDDGKFILLEVPRADDINKQGHVVGYRSVGRINQQAYFYKKGVFTAIATDADFPGADGSAATGINDHDDIVGYWFSVNVHGFIKKGKTYTTFDVPGADTTALMGINKHGDLVGIYTGGVLPTGVASFVYSNGEFTEINVPDAYETIALGINNHGQVVGYYFAPGIEAAGFVATPVKKKL